MKRLAAVAVLLLAGCSNMLPMTDKVWDVSDQEVRRRQDEVGADVSPEQIRNPVIDYKFEVAVPCLEMLRICYKGVPWYLKALGSVPMACTATWVQVERDPKTTHVTWVGKTAIAYSCWATPGIVMSHERQHLEGEAHRFW
jgi:hypothetical protein